MSKTIVLLAAYSALCAFVAFPQSAASSTVKPMKNAMSKGGMETACKNSGGNYYENERGGYGCTDKGGKWTMECGSTKKCVTIQWSRTDPKVGRPPVTSILDNNPGMSASGPGATGKPAAPAAPAGGGMIR